METAKSIIMKRAYEGFSMKSLPFLLECVEILYFVVRILLH